MQWDRSSTFSTGHGVFILEDENNMDLEPGSNRIQDLLHEEDCLIGNWIKGNRPGVRGFSSHFGVHR